ncbi:unnamed protein product [Triticum turgidum subsp. durum]|uniref:MATH domain-containing protein n=3 Tax=Triticum TaxID=4564 RepID=A0A9R0ZNV5_TRITD|nr:unnamed protein product [Triticum turgidum subsp. durum]
MGSTTSRSAPVTLSVPVRGYSKLLRSPDRLTVDNLFFCDLLWDIHVKSMDFDENGLADTLIVSVVINFMLHGFKSYAGTHITLEILDETGEHTVFHKESSRDTIGKQTKGSFILCVRRRELEASSCVSASYDKFTVRCTLKKMQQATKRRCLFGSLRKSNAVLEPPKVAMVGSHTLTVRSVSELSATLRNGECIYSTHFAVGGSTWYLKFCPRWGILWLVFASKGDEMTPTTAEFSFEFEGLVNLESQKTRHTFDRDNDDFYYHLKYTGTSPTQDDRLVVRCCLAVVTPEEVRTTIPTCSTESVLTPLLSAMHC